MTGLFNLKPVFSRYTATWDPNVVLEHLKGYPPATKISLKQLTLKLTMLIALISARRTQTIHLLSNDDMNVHPDRYVFNIRSLLKQSKSSGGKPIIFHCYLTNEKLCVVTHLNKYLKRTAQVRKKSQLLLCHAHRVKCHKVIMICTT